MNAKAARKIGAFYPPQRTLMGPGPSEIHPRVFSAMGRPTIDYLDPVFVEMMEELKELLRYAFQTRNALTFPVSGPGSVGMEMCFANMVEPGDQVMVCRNGVFGGRMIENVERTGGVPVVVEDAWDRPVDPQKVEDAFRAASGCEDPRLRARRDLDRSGLRRKHARGNRPPPRRLRSSTR